MTLTQIILLALGLVVLLGILYSKNRSEDSDEEPVTVEPVAPEIESIPVGSWSMVDDSPRSFQSDDGGDPNGGPDLLAGLALAISRRGTLPKFIGVCCTSKGVDKSPVERMIALTNLGIPVYEGHNDYSSGDSELAQAIIAESKKGKHAIVLGGPAGDIAWAMKNGAHSHNISLHGLLEDTWNAEGDNSMPGYQRQGMRASSEYVNQKLKGRIYQIRRPDYYHLIKIENLPPAFRNTNDFIDRNRDLEAWDYACSNHIMSECRRLNSEQGLTTGALRIADVLAMASFCGIRWSDSGAIMSAIQHGFNIMKRHANQ